MTNLYEQNISEIRHQAHGQELKLKERKLYSRNDLSDLNGKWVALCVCIFVLGLVLGCIIK